jgi:hypothetical protein
MMSAFSFDPPPGWNRELPQAERFPLLAMDTEAAATRDDLPPVEDAPAVARGGHRLRWRRRRPCWP